MKILLLLISVLTLETHAASPQCAVGAKRCIRSQGTEIPSKQAIEILDRCSDFTSDDLGRVALRMSYKDINAKSNGGLTPLVQAWHAFDYLYDSPLAFERKKKAEETNSAEIKRSCAQLDRDLNDDSKWTK